MIIIEFLMALCVAGGINVGIWMNSGKPTVAVRITAVIIGFFLGWTYTAFNRSYEITPKTKQQNVKVIRPATTIDTP